MHIYHCRYRRRDDPSGRVFRTTVIARNAEQARAYVALKDSRFGSTVSSPRRGKAVVEPESADGLTAAKAQDWRARLDGGRHGDIEVEVV